MDPTKVLGSTAMPLFQSKSDQILAAQYTIQAALNQILANQQEILKQIASTNAVTAKLKDDSS